MSEHYVPMNLDEKIAAARELLRGLLDRFAPGEVAVAWTGGKDSTLALALWIDVLRARQGAAARPLALSIDTGAKFPEVLAFRDRLAAEWDVDLRVVRPDVDLAGYPLAVDKLACCRELKIEPLKAALREHGVRCLITGIRRDEHISRADRQFMEERSDPERLEVHPLLDFTELDIWSAIAARGLPYCPLYDQGYRSLGCVPCTVLADAFGDERAGRDQDKERVLASLHHLGYF